MKKILPVLFAFLILLTLPVHAADGKLTATAAPSGDRVTITVRLQNPGIVATRIFVRYDSAALQLTGAENGDVFPKNSAVFGRDLSANPYTLLWDESLRRDNNTTDGTLCTVTFAVKGGTESGKTSVRFAVDRASTFDVDLNGVTVTDCSCSVDVPVVTTKAADTTAATTAKRASDTTTTTKAAQTTAASPRPSLTQPKPTAAAPRTTGTSGQTTVQKPSSASSAVVSDSSAAATSAVLGTAAERTTADAAQPNETKSAAPSPNEAAGDPVSDETVPDTLAADDAQSVSETQAEPLIDPAPPTNRGNLLWLLLLIPAAVAVVLFIRKKKA